MRRLLWGLIGAAVLPVALPGSDQASAPRGSSITLRKRLHVNTLITEPGTMEVEWGGLYSFSTSNFSMPSTIKFTPEGAHILWGRTEYSVAFDSLVSADIGGERTTEFSDRVTLTANSVIFDGEKLDFAFAPQVTYFLRGESGVRLGATGIARYDWGQNSAGATLSWTAATTSSPTNPAGTLDVGFGYGRRLRPSGLVGRFTPHCNVVWEKSTGLERVWSVFEGVEYQFTDRAAVDVSGQHFAIVGGQTDHQFAVGFTVNLGKLGNH